MNEQHREVQIWLEKLYGHDIVPEYEINQHSVALLHQLMTKSEQQERYAKKRIEDANQKAEEYRVEADRIAGVLKNVGLTTDDLSQSGTSSLRTLASTAALLEVHDLSDTNLLLAISDASQDAFKVQDLRRSEQRLAKNLQAKTEATLLKCEELKKVLTGLEQQDQVALPELLRKDKQTGFLRSKVSNYHHQIQALEIELTKQGADPSIYHNTLLRKSEELKELKERLHPLKAKLDSCEKLPPDESLAKVKMEEAKQQLAALEAELSKNVDLMHL